MTRGICPLAMAQRQVVPRSPAASSASSSAAAAQAAQQRLAGVAVAGLLRAEGPVGGPPVPDLRQIRDFVTLETQRGDLLRIVHQVLNTGAVAGWAQAAQDREGDLETWKGWHQFGDIERQVVRVHGR